NVLIRVREEEFHRQVIRRAQGNVEVCIELVFVVVPRQHHRVVDTAPRSLRARAYKCAIGVLRVQQIEPYRIHVRSVRGHGYTAECPGLAAEYSSKRGWVRADHSNTTVLFP